MYGIHVWMHVCYTMCIWIFKCIYKKLRNSQKYRLKICQIILTHSSNTSNDNDRNISNNFSLFFNFSLSLGFLYIVYLLVTKIMKSKTTWNLFDFSAGLATMTDGVKRSWRAVRFTTKQKSRCMSRCIRL